MASKEGSVSLPHTAGHDIEGQAFLPSGKFYLLSGGDDVVEGFEE